MSRLSILIAMWLYISPALGVEVVMYDKAQIALMRKEKAQTSLIRKESEGTTVLTCAKIQEAFEKEPGSHHTRKTFCEDVEKHALTSQCQCCQSAPARPCCANPDHCHMSEIYEALDMGSCVTLLSLKSEPSKMQMQPTAAPATPRDLCFSICDAFKKDGGGHHTQDEFCKEAAAAVTTVGTAQCCSGGGGSLIDRRGGDGDDDDDGDDSPGGGDDDSSSGACCADTSQCLMNEIFKDLEKDDCSRLENCNKDSCACTETT